MVVKSKLNGNEYNDEECVKIPNQLQAYKYMANKLMPIDIIYTDRIIFVFDRAESKSYFDSWCKREL